MDEAVLSCALSHDVHKLYTLRPSRHCASCVLRSCGVVLYPPWKDRAGKAGDSRVLQEDFLHYGFLLQLPAGVCSIAFRSRCCRDDHFATMGVRVQCVAFVHCPFSVAHSRYWEHSKRPYVPWIGCTDLKESQKRGIFKGETKCSGTGLHVSMTYSPM